MYVICYTDDIDSVTRVSSVGTSKHDREANKAKHIINYLSEWKNVLPPILCTEVCESTGELKIRNIHNVIIEFSKGMLFIF